MNALTLHHLRKAALEIKSHNPASDVFVPDAPDWDDVLDAKTNALLAECSRERMAELYADAFEVLMQRRGELVMRVADTWAAINLRWPDANARKDELAALGADVLRLVTEELRAVAKFELERE